MKHQFLEHFGSLQKPAAGAGGGHGKLASARGALKFTLWKLGPDAALSRLKPVQDASFM